MTMDRTFYESQVKNMSRYVHGSTARDLNIQREIESPRRQGLSHSARKNREKARHMSPGYVLFLLAALFVAGAVLIGYVRLQAKITTMTKEIATMEKQYNNLKIANDEELCRIESSIDLDEIKRVAIAELGMTYPKEGQIITYQAAGYDYVRKVSGDSY